jgi:hypothetical protein
MTRLTDPPDLSDLLRPFRDDRHRLRRDLYREQGRRCYYCRRPITLKPQFQQAPDYATFDHKEPVSRGGTDRRDNLVLACRRCNERKGDMTAAEFLAALAAAGVPGAAGRALAEAATATGTTVSGLAVAPGPVPTESAARPPGTPADHPATDSPADLPTTPVSSPLVVVGPAFLDPAPLDRLTPAQRRYVEAARAIDRAGGRVRYSTVAARLGVSGFAVRDMAIRIRAIDPALWPWEMGRIKGGRGTKDAVRPPGRPQEPADALPAPTDCQAPADASPPYLGGQTASQTASLELRDALEALQKAAARPAIDPLAGVAPAFRPDLAAQLAVARLVSGMDRGVARRALAWVLSVMDEGEMGGPTNG